MARYGRDYYGGRFARRGFDGETESDYDRDYGRDGRWVWSVNRDYGSSRDRHRGWGPQAENLDETWQSTSGFGPGYGRQRGDHGRDSWDDDPSWRDFGRGPRYGYSNDPYHGHVGRGYRAGHDYQEDFGDRLRRGWNRFRDEARDWMRGYDRDY
jgi:hypothetical protein